MRKALTLQTIVQQAGNQVSSDLDGERVLFELGAGAYYGLPGSGTAIWEWLEEPRPVAELRDALLARYDVEPERCEHELLAFLEELRDADLIEVREAGPAPRA